MILSMLYRNSPADLRLVLIDPKMLEFSLYNGIPHLLCPVVTDMNKAASALKWLTREMDRRYAVMSRMGVRHFNNYNEKIRRAAENGETIPDPLQSPEDPFRNRSRSGPSSSASSTNSRTSCSRTARRSRARSPDSRRRPVQQAFI